MAERPDVVIVGAGTAGCVLAARLSEDPSCSVLLLEAGPDYSISDLPADLVDGRHGPTTSHDWGLSGTANGFNVSLPRGRVVGGCSATNAGFALRGSPHDYDGWGMPGWSFAEVLPSFVALERDLDFGEADYHGDRGPVPIRRYTGAEQSFIAAATTEGLVAAGVRRIEDHNAPFAVGISALPVNTLDGRRMSTAVTHLEPARERPNLVVRGSALVRSVQLTGRRATGVHLQDGEAISAGEVIVSCGTYESPRLLRRSGLENPAIGSGLADHPAVSIDLPHFGPMDDVARFQLVATLHSSWADPARDAPDLQVIAAGPYPSDDRSPAVFFVGAAVLKPRSRGSVGDSIDLAYYSDRADLPRMLEGVACVEEAITHDAVRELSRGERLSPRLTDRSELETWLRAKTWSYHHPVGTCAMGAVVDELCRSVDVDGLSVVDASVMPDIPSANTNIPTLMLAEHVVRLRGLAV